MTTVPRSIFFSALERYASLALFFVSTAILSRLLSPAEFGTYAVVNALTAVIAAAFQEFGGANYLIQKQELSAASVRTAFTVTFAISAVVGVMLYVSAGLVAQFFDQGGLRLAVSVSAINFFVVPFSGTASALCRREMQFGNLAVCNLAAGAAASAVSVALAMLNFSYMAPIWGSVAGNVVLAAMLLARHPDLAVFRPSLVDRREVIGFGLYSSGVSVINVFYGLAPQLFLARILDFASVGLYSRAVNITQVFDKLVMQVLNPVIMPAIAARRTAGADLRGVYLEAVQLLSAVQWPFLLFVAIMARSIILIWLGQAWLEIVPLVRLLCIANLALFAACLSYPVLATAGHVRDALASSLISLPPSLLLILGASFFGVEAVAASALLTLPFQAAVALYFVGRRLGIGPRELARALLKSAAAAAFAAAGIGACAVLVELGAIGAGFGLICACVAAALSWWTGLAITGHPLLERLYRAAGGIPVFVPRLRSWRSVP